MIDQAEIEIKNTSNENLLITFNKLIDNKKLQLNFIWANKITQEDLCTPKSLEDSHQNIKLINNIFLSILKHATKINEMFERVLYGENDDYLNQENLITLFITTASLIQKIKNFLEIKTKLFKKEKFLAEPLIKLEKYFGLFKVNINEE